MSQQSLPAHSAHAYDAAAIRVASGANLGDTIAAAEDCEIGDVYRLDPQASSLSLLLLAARHEERCQILADGSDIGMPGDRLELLSLLTLMAPDGDKLDILFVRHEESGADFAMPLSPMVARVDYTLLAAQTDFSDIRIADIIHASFASGTMVTLPGGAQTAIEALQPGDQVLTRDHGPQPIRWIGKATLRAKGSFAPVVISAGTLGNLGDLVVSPHHRIFIYQRGQQRLGGTAELLVQARYLVDDNVVFRREGGFVDYYSLLFDQHEIIYAEGIPAESLMVNQTTVNLLPEELAEDIKTRFPGLSQLQHFGTEARREELDAASREGIFKRGKHS